MTPGLCRAGRRCASAAASAPPTAPASDWPPARSLWPSTTLRDGMHGPRGMHPFRPRSQCFGCRNGCAGTGFAALSCGTQPAHAWLLRRLWTAAGPLDAGPARPARLQPPVLRLQVLHPAAAGRAPASPDSSVMPSAPELRILHMESLAQREPVRPAVRETAATQQVLACEGLAMTSRMGSLRIMRARVQEIRDEHLHRTHAAEGVI